VNNTIPKYTYTIKDTLNELTILYHGKKMWLLAIYLVVGNSLLLLFPTLLTLQIINDHTLKSDNALLWIIGLGLLFAGFLYNLYVSLARALDALLDVETITIDDHSIRIEKSGFGSFYRCQEYPLAKDTCFHNKIMSFERSISFSP
jgi:hypothetical protein